MSTLADFYFSAERSGEILKRWIIDARLSLSSAADRIGVTYDTLSNCLRGAVKQPSLLVVFKICALTGHTLEEYVSLMLAGSDIDTGYRLQQDAPSAPVSAPAFAPVHGIDQAVVTKLLDRLDKAHADEIQRLEELHAHETRHMEQEITKLERRCNWLTCTLITENIALAAVLVYDLFSHDAGWFRTSGLLRGMSAIFKA